jgi:Family of unknown function (DUF5995)
MAPAQRLHGRRAQTNTIHIQPGRLSAPLHNGLRGSPRGHGWAARSIERALDRHLQAVDNLVACWTINSARDLAWQNAAVLWELRGDPLARGLFLDGLAAATALASRLLLTAV